MRVRQIVTFMSVDGAFGGPVSVADQQCRELIKRGHQVELWAGWDGQLRPASRRPYELRLFRARRLIPTRSFASLLSLRMLGTFALQHGNWDVVHVHLARDMVTMPIAVLAALSRGRLVVQCHGMIKPKSSRLIRVLDRVVVRPVLRKASAVLVLTDDESAEIKRVAAFGGNQVKIHNALEPAAFTPSPLVQRPPVFVFIARLHPRKRVGAFLEAAALLSSTHPAAKFEIFGPDEGDLENVVKFKLSHPAVPVHYGGPLAPDGVRRVLADAVAYVLPSEGEVFSMTMLEAMSVGTPVICSTSNGLSRALVEAEAGYVCDGSSRQIALMMEQVISARGTATDVATRAAQVLEQKYSTRLLGDMLNSTYAVR